MNFLKNRTVLGIICIVLSLIICFALTPLFNSSLSRKIGIVRVVKDIKAGEQITKEMVQTIEVGSYNLPENVVKSKDAAVGKYTTADLLVGDYILQAKLTNTPTQGNEYLYSLNGEKQAISVTIKSFSNGLSGKLTSGDIISVIAPDYMKQGKTVIPPELQYVEVIAVTADNGIDTDGAEQADDANKENKEKELPSSVTLLATPEQSRILAELDADNRVHLSLVYRGATDNASKFIKTQDEVLAKLYPKVEKDKTVENKDAVGTEYILPQKEAGGYD